MTAGSTPELRQPRFAVDATAGNHFAWFRTRLYLERTMMAWINTGITLIVFGFAIVQFFEQLARFTGVEPPTRLLNSLHFGLALIGVGVVALVVAGWQYRSVLRYLRHSDFAAVAGIEDMPAQTSMYALTIIVIFIGAFAFFAIAARAL